MIKLKRFIMIGNIWTYLSYFWKFNNADDKYDLSLEEASNILEEKENVENLIQTTTKETSTPVNSFNVKTGIITGHENNTFVIDNLYKFSTDSTHFCIGSKVSFSILISDGTENILDVNLVNNDWDVAESNSSLWNTRVIICRVEKQINRILTLSPGDVTIDLNNTSMDFLPAVGDWVELDVKCSVNENVIGLAGQIIEINKVSPIRAHIEAGAVTIWDEVRQMGVVNRNIFINKYSLSCGYIPKVGDKVIVEIIESDQNECNWRALKVIPEHTNKDLNNLDMCKSLPEFLEEYPGLKIDVPILNCDKLKQRRVFQVTIFNTCDDDIVLLNASFFESNGQCKVLNKFESNVKLHKDSTYTVDCECIAKNVGFSNNLLLFNFENFNLGKQVKVNVSINFKPNTNYSKPMLSYQQSSENEVVKGRRVSAPPRFISKQLPFYNIPKNLSDTVSKLYFRDVVALTEELKAVEPALFFNLSFFNFKEKFHTLIYLEEITNLLMIRNYDQEKACFIPYDDFLLLEIDNLSERRPSIVIGDKIIASDPLKKNGVDFEGYVHKVGAKHVFIKFSQLFHDNYKGEDYSVQVVPSRTSYRRLHHAIDLAPKILGKDILFPTKVNENDIQVEFFEEEANRNDKSSSPPSKKLSQLEVLKKLRDIKKNSNNNKSLSNTSIDEETKLKLEWYNNKLNRKQRDAVRNVLLGKARPLPYIIFGPPGTGKTVTIIEMILQIIRLIPQSRLLITAPSNSAADLIALRLIDSGVLKPGDLVRLVSYNYAVSDAIPINLIPYCATGNLARDGTANNEISHQGVQYECSRAALGRHRITVTTCSLAGQLHFIGFAKGHFSHIIVDEAGQASEPEVLTPLTFLDKSSGQLILAGDPKQLGPVVFCNIAAEYGLSDSYLERLINRFPYVPDYEGFPDTNGYDPRLVTKLLLNYRSLPSILKLISSLFYNDELIATIDDKISEEAVFLGKLGEILPKTNRNTTPCLVFHGVNGENYQSSDSPSWYNPHEAAQVFYYINELYRLGVGCGQVGIITPYIKQVKEIRSLLMEAEFDVPKVGTVEEFQGQEFNVIILSTVRSCQEYVPVDVQHSLGFISSPKRLNVAISRSKSLLIIIGNPNLLCGDKYWRSVVEYCLQNGSYTGCESFR